MLPHVKTFSWVMQKHIDVFFIVVVLRPQNEKFLEKKENFFPESIMTDTGFFTGERTKANLIALV